MVEKTFKYSIFKRNNTGFVGLALTAIARLVGSLVG